MRAVIYARVSTEEQDVYKQVEELKTFVNNKRYELVGVYTDVISGATSSRPQLNLLMQDAYKKKFDVIVVWKLDRIGRSLPHLIDLTNKFKNWNINFICYTQPIDTTTSEGTLFFHMIAAFAQFERDIISERTKLGIKHSPNRYKVGKRGKDKKVRRKGGYYLRYQKKGG